jgi:2-isopropylmalate synthase
MEEQVLIFDTTLTAGERSPGCSMNLEDKLRLARQLERLKVDIIEAGIPGASAVDFEAARFIARAVEHSIVAARTRAQKDDVDKAWDAIHGAKKPRIHIAADTSGIHLSRIANREPRQVIEEVAEAVRHAKTLCSDVQFSCLDATRTTSDFLCSIVASAIDAGATTITLNDSLGYSLPDEYGTLFRLLRERVAGTRTVRLSARCQNDLGLATASAIAALQNGARQVECTVNGIGERAGLAPLEEVVMAITSRRQKLGLHTGVATEEIFRTSRLLSSITGMLVQRNKALVGTNAFVLEGGVIHDDGGTGPLPYELISPAKVGIKHGALVLGRHSEKTAVQKRYGELGYLLSGEDLERVYPVFCTIAEQKREVFDEDLIAILEESAVSTEEFYHLDHLQVTSGTNVRPTATVELRQKDQRLVDSATGDGPVDAVYRAIERITGVVGKLTEYSIKSVSLGHDAIGEVFVRAEFDGVSFNGRAASTDVIIGSAKAYLEALNRGLAAKRRKG